MNRCSRLSLSANRERSKGKNSYNPSTSAVFSHVSSGIAGLTEKDILTQTRNDAAQLLPLLDNQQDFEMAEPSQNMNTKGTDSAHVTEQDHDHLLNEFLSPAITSSLSPLIH